MNDVVITGLTKKNNHTTPLQAYSVSEINHLVSEALSSCLSTTLTIEGEISNLSVAGSGHRYFSLKDSQSTISCALFKGSSNRIARNIINDLKNGDSVIIKANISVYEPRGSYQLIVSDIEPAGFGALAKAFVELKRKLDDLGLTAIERKKNIPQWPQSIALVTSETGAAVKDVIATIRRRSPFIPCTIYHTLVQGKQAPDNIIQALNSANSKNSDASIILLVRGGGSLEDLQAFNDESVALTVANSRLPIVSGVGHETDFTIVDFVSDCRAATPTAAAELVSPDKALLTKALNKQSQRLTLSFSQLINHKNNFLQSFEKRLVIQHPHKNVLAKSQQIDEYSERLTRSIKSQINRNIDAITVMQRQLHSQNPLIKLQQSQMHLNTLYRQLTYAISAYKQSAKQDITQYEHVISNVVERLKRSQQQIKGLEARLLLLSPLGILQRGYAIAFDNDGTPLRRSSDTDIGDEIVIRLGEGELKVEVLSQSKS